MSDARQHLPRVAHEELEQMRFGRRQLEAAAAAARLHRAEIEREVGEAQEVGRLRVDRAPQQRPQTRKQLLERERLRQVVVRARVEPVDPVADGIARGQQQDGHAVPLAAEPARDVEPVVAGHHHVEDDGVRRPLRDRRERSVAVGGELHVVAGELEGALERLPDRAIVICHENEHLLCKCARET